MSIKNVVFFKSTDYDCLYITLKTDRYFSAVNVPSWCPVWSVSPLSSGEGTLGNYESETDASCVRSKQPKNKFPSRRNLARPRHVHALFTAHSWPPAHFCTAAAQRRRNAVCAFWVRNPEQTVFLPSQRIQNLELSGRACLCQEGLRNVQPSRAAQAHLVADVRVRALLGPTASSERRPPSGSFTTSLTALDLSALTYLEWMRAGEYHPLEYNTRVHVGKLNYVPQVYFIISMSGNNRLTYELCIWSVYFVNFD